MFPGNIVAVLDSPDGLQKLVGPFANVGECQAWIDRQGKPTAPFETWRIAAIEEPK